MILAKKEMIAEKFILPKLMDDVFAIRYIIFIFIEYLGWVFLSFLVTSVAPCDKMLAW